MDAQLEFDRAYWASQPPEIRALPGMADPDQRASRAAELAANGFTVDVPIMVWGWDAYLVMKMRSDYGYTWVPSALQPAVTIAPGLLLPGVVPYEPAHPPAGSIRVSINVHDYPPFDPAPPTRTPAGDNPVGLQSIGNLYLSVAGDNYEDQAKYTDARGTFVKHVAVTPFGRTSFWEKIG